MKLWRTTCLAIVACAFALGSSTRATSARVDVTRATLSNGLRIVVLRDPLAPVVSTWLNVEAGSDDERFTGLAHAQEHMFYRGSKTLSGAAADRIAGFTGDQDNADTQSQITQYFHLVPASDLDLALQLDASRFTGILDSQHDWSQERGAIEQEVTRDNSDADYRLTAKLLAHAMAGTPYADDGLGTIASFSHQIDAPQLRAFYRTWYHPNNAIYVIAGDVDPKAAIASVRRYLGAIAAAPVPAHRYGHLSPLRPATFVDTSDQSNVEAEVAYRFPGYANPAFAASVVLGDVLNSQRGALYGLVAAGKAQSVEANLDQWPTAGLIQIVSRVAIGTKPQTAIANLEAVVARYRARGVPANLVEAAKQQEIVRVRTLASNVLGLASTWSETVATQGRTPEEDAAAIARVTPADVDAVVRAYLTPATANVAYAVPKNVGSAGGGNSASAGASAAPKQRVATVVHLPAWAVAALRHLTPPQRTIAPTTFVLGNGLHIVVQPERASPLVAVDGTVLHDPGLEEPAGELGVQGVLEELMPYGTTTYARLAYRSQIDAISATMQNGFAFKLSVPSGRFERGMQLLADDELHPALDAKSFAIVKASRVAALRGDATNPDHLALVAEAGGLYPPGDPARRFANAASVATLTLGDVRAAYARAFRPDLTTIAIVGDVTPERARAVAERYFGSWKAVGVRPNVFARAVADNVPSRTDVPATGRLQDTVRLAQTLPLALADPDLPALDVANTVLSGDFSSLLIRDMRVTTGYVYFVGTNVVSSPKRATFSASYGCSPENVSKAQTVFERDLARLQTSTLGRERVLRAQSRLISLVALQGQSYEGLAARLTANVSQGLPATYDFTLARAELAVTPQTIRTATSRWIRPHGFVRIVEGPHPN